MLFGKKYIDIEAVTAYDILDRALAEDAKYEELKEYGEATLKVAKELMEQTISKEVITLNDVAVYENAVADAHKVTLDAVKHAYARDVLIELYHTKLTKLKG